MTRPPKYPNRELVADLLAETAKAMVAESRVDHPDDIAVAMMTAVEVGGLFIEVMWKRGLFDEK